jgi:hypothetical protein
LLSALPMLSLMSKVQVGRMMSVWILFQRMSNSAPVDDRERVLQRAGLGAEFVAPQLSGL